MTIAAANRFSQTLWQDNQAQYDAIVAMPFNAELADGSLPMTPSAATSSRMRIISRASRGPSP